MRVVLLMTVALHACDDAPKTLEFVPAANMIETSTQRAWQVKGNDKQTLMAQFNNGMLGLTVRNFPRGTRIKVGEVSHTTSDDFSSFDVAASKDIAGGFLVGDKHAVYKHPHKVEVDAKGAKGSFELELSHHGALEMFRRAKYGGIEFAQDLPQRESRFKILWTDNGKVYGDAKLFSHIDGVVISQEVDNPERTKHCTEYREVDGSGKLAQEKEMFVFVHFKDTYITLYDRRSGKTLERVRLSPPQKCPRSVRSSPGKTIYGDGVPKTSIEKWIMKRVEEVGK